MARRVLIVAHPGALGMELLGVRDILVIANALCTQRGEPAPYRIEIAVPGGAEVPLWGGLALTGVRDLSTTRVAVDTLVVVGGPVAEQAAQDERLVGGVRRLARRSRRVVGVCTGALILAAAGLLGGRRATTHWNYGNALAAHPDVAVDTDPIYITDGNIWTSAGVTAGFDLVLALVEADEGRELAREVAQQLVLYLRRTGTQSQFSAAMSARAAQRHPLRDVQTYIHERPGADLSLAALAEYVHMSPRHFARVFTAEVGVSPGRYVERVRLETARRLLTESDEATETIARAAGFGNYQALRRAFVSSLGVSPAEYRRRFGARPDLELVPPPPRRSA